MHRKQLENSGIYQISWGINLEQSSFNNINKNIFLVNKIGIILNKSSNNNINRNIFQDNKIGILAQDSSHNSVLNNSFIMPLPSGETGWIIYILVFQIRSNNIWDGNYWNEPRSLPKPIFGIFGIDIDWNPAKEPYDIPIPEAL